MLIVSLASCVATAAPAQQEPPVEPEQEEPSPAPAQEPRHFEPFPSRWLAPGWPIRGVEPPAYEINRRGSILNPYRQHPLKGDFPLFGTQDVFLNFTATDRFVFNQRQLPTPSGITGPGPVPPDFFGDGDQTFILNDLALTFDLFKGQQAFKPVDWRLKITPVFNVTYLDVEEVGVVNVDVSEGDTRTWTDFALQEAFFEYHLFDLSDRYDFISVEAGILPFRSDFRGFIFDDSNLGVRLLGNADENKWQYNLAFFDMLDKDTNSLLNEFEDREQEIVIANLYRQDFPVLGYISQLSFHYNHDHRGFEFDDNGFLVSPAPVGLAQTNDIDAFYLGWAGEGHFGRVNVTHAFYQVLGNEDRNAFAARAVNIDAQLAALELSVDFDWWRPRIFGLWASGDNDPRDGDAEGFDGIIEAPNFAGGELSLFNQQAIRLLGVNLTQLGSPYADLSTSRFQGQSNFVNPGLIQLGGAIDVEITPKWRAQGGGNWLRFHETQVLEDYLELPDIDPEIGTEFFVGTQYRPLLTNNVIFQVGASALFPDDAFTRIYQSRSTLFSVFTTVLLSW